VPSGSVAQSAVHSLRSAARSRPRPGSEPHSARARNYFVKNLDLLLQVTGTEDFPMMEEIQRNLASGALQHLVYGRIEPPLVHFHREVNKAVALAAG
jgi:hypothetical protein